MGIMEEGWSGLNQKAHVKYLIRLLAYSKFSLSTDFALLSVFFGCSMID